MSVSFENFFLQPVRHPGNANDQSLSAIHHDPLGVFQHPNRVYVLTEEEMRIDRTKLLSEGGYGTVYLKQLSEKWYAQKVISNIKNMKELILAMKEVQNLMTVSRFRSDHFLQLYAVGFEVLTTSLSVQIITEYHKHGTLLDVYETMSVAQKLRLMRQLAYALLVLHKNKLVHGDLKPGNVLINSELEPLVCDFGSMTVQKAKQSNSIRPRTLQYSTPELVAQQITNDSTDVYAFGCILLEVLSFKRPYWNMTEGQIHDMLRLSHTQAESFLSPFEYYKQNVQSLGDEFQNPIVLEVLVRTTACDASRRMTVQQLVEKMDQLL